MMNCRLIVMTRRLYNKLDVGCNDSYFWIEQQI
jgi:hypothetical protein